MAKLQVIDVNPKKLDPFLLGLTQKYFSKIIKKILMIKEIINKRQRKSECST